MSKAQTKGITTLNFFPNIGKTDVLRQNRENEKVSSHRESNAGHLACAANALPLNYSNGTEMPQSHKIEFIGCLWQNRGKCKVTWR